MNNDTSLHPRDPADLLAVGFGTATLMWILGYILHMPIIHTPPAAMFGSLIAALIAGGWILSAHTSRGFGAAILVSLLTATINIIILGSINADWPQVPITQWLPGYYLATTAIFLLGYIGGRARRRPNHNPRANWSMRLASVAVLATILVVTAGGIVTGFDAGFAVPDWPTSYSINMFAFPLSRMTGGIYYEHAHRLAGTLVGLISIVLMIYIFRADSRKSVKALSFVALLMVAAQGIAGGAWVLKADLPYVLFHGISGQLILAAFTVLAATQSKTWRDPNAIIHTPSAKLDRTLAVSFFLIMLLQISLGVVLRKANTMLLEHITMAAVATSLAMLAAGRAWMIYGKQQHLMKRIGFAILHVIFLQLILGVAALIARDADSPALSALVTTLHQITGAALLAMSALLVAWTFRLVKREPLHAMIPT